MRTIRLKALLWAIAVLILIVPGSTLAQPKGYDKHQVVKIRVADDAQLEVLRALDAAGRDLEIWSEVLRIGIIEARVSPDQKRVLKDSGLEYTVHIEDLQAHIDEMYADKGKGFFDQYRTYSEHVSFLNDLAAQYPTLAQTVDLGPSVQGRSLLALRISGPGENKVGLIYHGAQHGNEQAGAMLVAKVAHHLLAQYTFDPEIKALVDDVEWYLLPIMNPDGHEAYSRYNMNGVDLNRNWGGPGSGNDPSGGPYPFSEPETAALRDFFLAHPNVRLHLDVHGYVPWFIWPWAHKAEYCPEQSTYLSVGENVRTLISAAGGPYFQIGTVWEVAYITSGCSCDYSYGDLNVWAYGLELATSSIPNIYDHYFSSMIYLGSTVIGAQMPPEIINVAPLAGILEGGTAVTVSGYNFDAGTTVSFNDQPATDVVIVDPETITCLTPANPIPGWVDVSATNTVGSDTLPLSFHYIPPAGAPPMNLTDVDTMNLISRDHVLHAVTGQPGKLFLVFLSMTGGGPNNTKWGIMGLDAPLIYGYSGFIDADGYMTVLLSMPINHSGYFNFYTHALVDDSPPVWSTGGNNPNGSGSIMWGLN